MDRESNFYHILHLWAELFFFSLKLMFIFLCLLSPSLTHLFVQGFVLGIVIVWTYCIFTNFLDLNVIFLNSKPQENMQHYKVYSIQAGETYKGNTYWKHLKQKGSIIKRWTSIKKIHITLTISSPLPGDPCRPGSSAPCPPKTWVFMIVTNCATSCSPECVSFSFWVHERYLRLYPVHVQFVP